MKIKSIIIDDEAHCRNTLAKQLEWYCPEVEVIANCNGSVEGLQRIQELSPQLIFLDIDMPIMNGFEMLEQLKEINFNVIFTTAYDEYAILAFNNYTTAYLLKPIDGDDLVRAIHKVKNQNQEQVNSEHIFQLLDHLNQKNENTRVLFPTSEGIEFVDWKNIIYCKADSNYTEIHLNDQPHLVISKSLKETTTIINQPNVFIRPHASYLVNLNFIKKYQRGSGGLLTLENGIKIPVSKGKKADFIEQISF